VIAAAKGELVVTGVVAGYFASQPVLRGVSLTARAGRVTVILGPNGAGKSTLLRVCAGILKPSAGAIVADGVDVTPVPPHRMLEQGIALLPQGRSTFPLLSVDENLELGGWIVCGSMGNAALRASIDAMYDRYPLLKPVRAKAAGTLSGGQQRILEIARMLVSNPNVLLIDEPSAGLAPNITDQVYEELTKLKELGKTILLVDQNVRSALDIGDDVYTLESGRNHLNGERGAFTSALDDLIRGWLRL
jgi:branched-chain amino acid transport system ATP-binding protein